MVALTRYIYNKHKHSKINEISQTKLIVNARIEHQRALNHLLHISFDVSFIAPDITGAVLYRIILGL